VLGAEAEATPVGQRLLLGRVCRRRPRHVRVACGGRRLRGLALQVGHPTGAWWHAAGRRHHRIMDRAAVPSDAETTAST
jgi:hypothetical protein